MVAKDVWHKLTNWADKNRFLFFSILLLAIMAFTIQGCLESKTLSLKNQGKEVTRSEFVSEAVIIQNELELKRAEIAANMEIYNLRATQHANMVKEGLQRLDDQDLRNAELLENVGGFATMIAGGGVTPAGIIGALVTSGGLAFGIANKLDNRRKDKKILELKNTT